MLSEREGKALNDFLGSAQIFTSAVTDLMARQLRDITNDEVTFAQLKLLKMVSLTKGYSVSNVAQFLGVSTAAASRAVDRLVRRGLVNRTEAPEDRRAVELSLTSKGQALLASYDTAAANALDRVFQDLSADQLGQVGELLDRLSVSIVDRADDTEDVCFRCGIHFRDRCLLRQRRSRTCFFHLHQRKPDDGDGNGKHRSAPERGAVEE
jgi:DNA-binding MarR family transcriptional regulator